MPINLMLLIRFSTWVLFYDIQNHRNSIFALIKFLSSMTELDYLFNLYIVTS